MLFSRSVGFTIKQVTLIIDWQSWLTQADVDEIKSYGLNSVRIPLGFWLIEEIVDRKTEKYARGGLDELVCLF